MEGTDGSGTPSLEIISPHKFCVCHVRVMLTSSLSINLRSMVNLNFGIEKKDRKNLHIG